jgi:hypothetical protein
VVVQYEYKKGHTLAYRHCLFGDGGGGVGYIVANVKLQFLSRQVLAEQAAKLKGRRCDFGSRPRFYFVG